MLLQSSLRIVRGAAAVTAILAAACGGAQTVVTADELYSVLQANGPKPLVLDVRTPREFDGGHVPGAVNIPHTQLQLRLAEIQSAAGAGVVVYCEVGTRSQFALSLLRQAGYENVQHLAGDMAGWRRAGLPIAR
jgi:rhodanese-related sulfurtransferase